MSDTPAGSTVIVGGDEQSRRLLGTEGEVRQLRGRAQARLIEGKRNLSERLEVGDQFPSLASARRHGCEKDDL